MRGPELYFVVQAVIDMIVLGAREQRTKSDVNSHLGCKDKRGVREVRAGPTYVEAARAWTPWRQRCPR